ncbi:ABC transporter substrate-binding protein [Rossellomorea vietnamensis]|uniref:ABC transporter substrate-binding protein n=1 Tax=Rossellomorea vietnamensis TaxID=218284 RepID=A0A0P6WDD6_9BACI|nr:cobalamin-binding protein [Rossellomorea vietnamensis]KPL59014.1 ABC transporter substrate-binding protein [Rossellomorea vietnamensis]
MKIVSICPSNTEIIDYLGLTPLLAGVDDYSDYPREVKSLPQLGPDLSINMDKLESLKPDLVFSSLSVPGMEKNIEELERRNIPHITLNPQSFTDIADDLLTVGKACGIEEHALKRQQEFMDTVERLKTIGNKVSNPPSLYWEWWPKPVFTPGRVNWLTELSTMVGARNLFEDVDLASVQTEWEDVLKRNPDYICLAWVGVQQSRVKPEIVKKRPGWNTLDAVQEDRIFVLEEALYCRPSPLLLKGAEKLARLLHPGLYNDSAI